MRYRKAPEVKEIADEIIPQRHGHLVSVPILYLFRETAQETKGRTIWGKAAKLTGKAALYARDMLPGYTYAQVAGFKEDTEAECFEITIAYDIWCRLSEKWRRWLVNHELSHCVTTDEGKLTTVPHDLEIFYSDADGFGMSVAEFRAIFRDMGAAALPPVKQLPLEGLGEGETKLPGVSSVTILTPDDSVTLTGNQFERFAETVRRNGRNHVGLPEEPEGGDDEEWDTGQPDAVAALADAHRSSNASDDSISAPIVDSLLGSARQANGQGSAA